MKDELMETLNKGELTLKVAGIACPLFSLLGAVAGFFSKKQTIKNIKYIKEKLEQIEITIGKITEEQERNFTFRVSDIVNKSIKERRVEKIDIFTEVIKNGIIDGSVLSESEEIDKIIETVSQLHLEDIEFLENFYNTTRFELKLPRLLGGQGSGNYSNRPFTLDDFKINTLRDAAKKINHRGFKKNAVAILHKCIANGLVKQEFRAEAVLNAGKENDEEVKEYLMLGKSNLGFEYSISDYYIELRKYLLGTKKEQ